jgi:RNA polymerase sigma factor (sigma-70 family)
VARRGMHLLFQQAGWLASGPQAGDPTDGDLLGGSDTTGMDALVRRHGPMVWATCKQMLPDPSEAEDAFQATFLVLLQSAKKLRSVKSLGGWLHGVAVKVCWKQRRSAVRRKQRDAKSAQPEALPPTAEPAWDGLYSVVHDEVEKLPATLRTAFVLCELQGQRPGEAATQLGWKLGTLSGRLTRARQQLMKKLTARGFAPLVVVAATATTAANAAVPLTDTLLAVGAVIHHPANLIPSTVLGLAKAITGGISMKMKLVLATGVLVTGLTVGLGWKHGNEVNAQVAAPPAGVAPPGAGGPPKSVDYPKPASAAPATLPPAGAGAGMGPGGSGSAEIPAKLPAGPGAGGSMMPALPGLGGMGSGMVGPAALSKPTATPVEHTMTNVPGNLNEMNRMLTQMGGDGWTFVGQVTLGDKDSKLVFTKQPKVKTTTPAAWVPGVRGPDANEAIGYDVDFKRHVESVYDPETKKTVEVETIVPVARGASTSRNLPSPVNPATTSPTSPTLPPPRMAATTTEPKKAGILANESKSKLKIEVIVPKEGTNLSSLKEIAMLVLTAAANEEGIVAPSPDSVLVTDTGHMIVTGASPKALEALKEVMEKIEHSKKPVR